MEITPSALANIGYKTYIIFAVLNIANAIIVWCFYPETAGLTLESVDRIFVETDLPVRHGDRIHRKLQRSMVGRAAVAVDKHRKESVDVDSNLEARDSNDQGKGSQEQFEGSQQGV